MNTFANLRIGKKLGLGFGMIFMFCLIIVSIFQYTIHSLDEGFQGLLETEVEIDKEAKEIARYMLQCRRNEKDFLLHRDQKYMKKHDVNCEHLHSAAEQIIHDSKEADLTEITDTANSILEYLDQYQNLFHEMCSSYELMGLDHNSGLQGKFRKQAHLIGEELKAVSNPDVKILLLEARKHEKDYLLRHDPKYVDRLDSSVQGVHLALSNSALSSEDIDRITSALGNYQAGFLELVAEQKIIDQEIRKLRTAVHQIEPAVSAIEELSLQARSERLDVIQRTRTRNASFSMILGVIAMASGVFIAIILTRMITGAMNKAIKFAETITSGDLTLEISNNLEDETGILSRSLNEMSKNLRKLVTEVAETSATISSSSEEIAATSSELSSSAENLQSQSATVTTASGDMTSNLNQITESSQEMASSVNTASAAIEEMNSSLSEVAKSCSEGSRVSSTADTQAQSTCGLMSQLNESASEIGKVLDSIRDIADQTNLLALNATIEAASAGEAGKGFAVVANEVKDLAKQTATATEDISQQIYQMQTSTATAVSAIDDISKVISEVNTINQTIASAVEEQSATIQEISNTISNSSQAATIITDSVSETSGVADEITKSIQDVDMAAKGTASAATETNASATELAKMSTRLNDLVGQFKY